MNKKCDYFKEKCEYATEECCPNLVFFVYELKDEKTHWWDWIKNKTGILCQRHFIREYSTGITRRSISEKEYEALSVLDD